jgi:hypothetical protein
MTIISGLCEVMGGVGDTQMELILMVSDHSTQERFSSNNT